MTEIFYGFPQSFWTNAEMVSQIISNSVFSGNSRKQGWIKGWASQTVAQGAEL
jgi:hypothetical protein